MESMVSIIIPAYNAEDYIERCVNSCLNQTYQAIEILVIDDGSNDNTRMICRKLQKGNANIKLVEKQNSGVSDTRNSGILHATGDYILFLDADDYINEDYCKTLISHFEKDIDLVVAGYHKVSKTGVLSSEVPKTLGIYSKSEIVDLIKALLECNCLCTCWNKMYKKEKIIDGFRKDMSFAEDSVFVMQYIKNCTKAKLINHIGYNYCIDNAGSAMNRYHVGMFSMFNKEYEAMCSIEPNELHLQHIAFSHYMDNLFYWGLPQIVCSQSLTLNEKIAEIKRIGEIDDMSQKINEYVANRKKHKIWAWLIGKRCYYLLYLWLCIEHKFKIR